MKKRIYLVAIIGVALVAGILTPDARGQKGLDMIPADIQGILTVNNLERLYTTMGIAELRAEYPEAFQKIAVEMVEEFGVDLLNTSALREFGLDPGAPLHIGAIGDPTPALFVMLPAQQDAKTFVGSQLKLNPDAYPQKVKKGGVEIYADEDEEIAFFAKGKYIVLVVTDDEEDDVSAIEAAGSFLELSSESQLSDSKDYARAMKKISGDADMTFYMGPELYKEMIDLSDDDDLPDQKIDPDEMMDLYERWGLTRTTAAGKIKLGSDRITAETYSWLREDSDILAWYRIENDPIPFLGRVPSEPMLVALGRTNVSAIWNSINDLYDVVDNDSLPPLEESMDELNKETGLDVVNDIIKQVDGNIGLLLNGVDFTGIDAVLLLQVSQPQRFGETLARLVEEIDESITIRDTSDPNAPQTELTREEFGGVSFHHLVKPPNLDVCFGMVEDHLVLTPSVARFQSVVTGDGNFVERIGNADVQSALKDPTGGVFYVDFGAVARNVEQMAPMFGSEAVEVVELLRELDELVSTTRFDGDGLYQTTSLTSSKPGIWKRLLALVLEDYEEDQATPDQQDDIEDDEEDAD